MNLIVKEAYYILDNACTIRECAKHFKRSKSTIHRDLRDKLMYIDYDLYMAVSNVILHNKKMRHIRGGASMRRICKEKKLKKALEEVKCCKIVE